MKVFQKNFKLEFNLNQNVLSQKNFKTTLTVIFGPCLVQDLFLLLKMRFQNRKKLMIVFS